MSSLYIVDINSLVFRSYYGIKQELTAPDGTPVRAVYGVIKMLVSIIKSKNPTELVIVYDSQKQLKRSIEYKEYKANRTTPPDDLKVQFPLLKTFVQKSKLESFEIDGYEADDLIASLVIKYKDEFDEIVIVTSDKDLMQMVDDNIFVYDEMKDIVYDSEKIFEKFGVYPVQIVDYLSLIGDASDNVPGVKGIGPKGAVELLTKFKTLDGIYKNISLVNGKKKDLLIESQTMAYLSKKLIMLNKDLPVSINKYFQGGIDLYTNDLLNYYSNLGMKSIVGNRQFIVENEDNLKKTIPYTDYLIFKATSLDDITNFVKKEEMFSVYIETTENNISIGEVFSISLCKNNQTLFIPFLPKKEFVLEDVLNTLKPFLESEQVTKVCHDAKYFIHFLNKFNIEFKTFFDTMVASYILDATANNHSLENAASYYLNTYVLNYSQAVSLSKNKTLLDVEEDKVARYICEKSYLLLLLKNYFENKLKENKLEDVYYKIDIPLVPILCKMEQSGIKVDVSYLQNLKKLFNLKRKEIEEEIFKKAEYTFNLNSPKQLSELLFDKLNLPVIRKTKTQNSTDEEVLEKLTQYSDIPKLILEYRELTKLVTTYVESLINLSKDEVIHTTFNQNITATGRLSSSNPNLQNIPIKTETGREIRKSFVAREGKKFVIIDYSQIELRILAHLSQDDTFVDAFKKGEDIHTRTASEIFNIPVDKVTKEQRSASKSINFGLIYGMGSYKLSTELKIDIRKATEYINHYFEHYAKIKDFKDSVLKTVKETQKINTYFGRVRYFKEINSQNVNIKNHTERMAFNTLIQGTAADLLKIVMVEVYKYILTLNYDAKMLLQVHDELVFEVESEQAENFSKEVKNIMENTIKFSVPFNVECAISQRWEK